MVELVIKFLVYDGGPNHPSGAEFFEFAIGVLVIVAEGMAGVEVVVEVVGAEMASVEKGDNGVDDPALAPRAGALNEVSHRSET